MEEKKRLQMLEAKLSSKNISVIAETIRLLRDESRFPGAIRLLSELYDRIDNRLIMSMISNFMNDLKESDLRGEVIDEMMKPYNPGTISMLASSCWQSGQDYSEYAPQFATLFLRNSYQVALESFTVLEESAMHITPSTKKEVLDIFIKNGPSASPEKAPLLKELVKIYS